MRNYQHGSDEIARAFSRLRRKRYRSYWSARQQQEVCTGKHQQCQLQAHAFAREISPAQILHNLIKYILYTEILR